MPFAGHFMDENVAFQLALGNLDAETLEPLDTYNPDTAVGSLNKSLLETNVSIWSKNFIKEQDSSVLIESETAKKISAADNQPTSSIDYSRDNADEQGTFIYHEKSTSLFNSCSSILAERKRKLGEMCSSSENQGILSICSKFRSDPSSEQLENKKLLNEAEAGLNFFTEPILGENKSISENFAEKTGKNSDAFVNLKTLSNHTNTTFQTSCRKNGKRANIQSENIGTNDEVELDIHLQDDVTFPITCINNFSNSFKPNQATVTGKSSTLLTEVFVSL